MAQARSDIGIVGAGPLGLALALALHRKGLSSCVFDARTESAFNSDARILALSHGSRQLLESLGTWPESSVTPIQTIHVSQRGGFGRVRILAEDLGLPALGYVVSAARITESLRRQVFARRICVRYDTRVQSLGALDGALQTRLTSPHGPEEREVSLLACCEGSVSDEAPTIQRDYGQHALLCRATVAVPHKNVAYERFTPDGPVALLPLGKDYAVVWTVATERVEALMTAGDDVWREALQAAIGPRVQITNVKDRAHYALGLKMRRKTVGDRVVWLGNAAQTLHPVAGQGFNLALRDAWELADSLAGHPDPGAASLLRQHALKRRADRVGAAGFTDFLVRGFASDLPFLPAARGLGLMALDLLPPLRHFVAKRMLYGARAWP